MVNLTLGSLFDGSGGFPLGGLISGITPVWAAEIEPFPIRVTTKRLPFMKHYGDISTMDGSKIEPVDIITFGSPCQDLSVAGGRGGLDGKRSGLFYEAVRIIKEMRCATDGKKPRYIVWENVPEPSHQTKEKISDAFLKASAKSRTRPYQSLRLISGNKQETLWETIFPLLGECLTLNTGECPNEENASSLSQILQVRVPKKYYLSPKACRGILRRAFVRGKVLPAMLQTALERLAQSV
jgi:hypothetical protein